MAVADKAFGAIRAGDKFTDKQGNVWTCIDVQPFGQLDMFCDAKSRFTYMRHADVRRQLHATEFIGRVRDHEVSL